MKNRAFVAALCAGLLLGALAFPAFAQGRGVNYETYVLDSFDDAGDEPWMWIAAGSRFITDGYPVVKYFDGMPGGMRVMQDDPYGEYRVLGVQFKFNRQGDNWVDLIPVMPGEDGEDAPYEIPLRGIVSRIEMWVWGAGYLYELEVLVRDYEGRVHTLPLGRLNYEGWRNLTARVPTSIPQTSRYLNDNNYLSFVAIRIRTTPRERVDDFYVFFDQLKVVTDTYKPSYDGFEFVNADFSQDGYYYDNYDGEEEDSGL